MSYVINYFGAYLLLLVPVDCKPIPVQVPLQGWVAMKGDFTVLDYLPVRPVIATAWRFPEFRNGDPGIRRYFTPLIGLDMRIRRDYWRVVSITPNG